MQQMGVYCNLRLTGFAYTAQIAGAKAKEKVNERKRYQSTSKSVGHFYIRRISDVDGWC